MGRSVISSVPSSVRTQPDANDAAKPTERITNVFMEMRKLVVKRFDLVAPAACFAR